MRERSHPNIGGKRWCSDCECYYPLSEFYKNYQYYQTRCKLCARAKMSRYQKRQREVRKAETPHGHVVNGRNGTVEPSLKDRVRQDICIKGEALYHVRCETPLVFGGAELHLDGREERWWCYACLESVYAVAPGGHSALVPVAV